MFKKSVLLSLVVLIGLVTVPVFAEAISVTTDKLEYKAGEFVTISGEVQQFLAAYPVTLQIISPSGEVITLEQIEVSESKEYNTEIQMSGDMFGTYLVKVLYATESRTAETTFQFNAGIAEMLPPEPKIPSWIRNIFIWYAEDRISEDELLESIQFLLDQGILKP